jgi:beta-xylosidase
MAVQKGAEGRVTHLEPVVWNSDGWPVMGNDPNHTGDGEPVTVFKKPSVGQTFPAAAPQTSDDFVLPKLGLQWQWLANPQPGWYSLTDNPGHLRLFAQPANASLVRQPNLLLQKIPAPTFNVVTKMEFTSSTEGDKAGLIIYGAPCAWIGLVKTADGWRLSQTVSRSGAANAPDNAKESAGVEVKSNAIWLAFSMSADSRAQLSYSLDGSAFVPLGDPVTVAAVKGSWIGAKFGLFALGAASSAGTASSPAYADFDWIHVASTAGQ